MTSARQAVPLPLTAAAMAEHEDLSLSQRMHASSSAENLTLHTNGLQEREHGKVGRFEHTGLICIKTANRPNSFQLGSRSASNFQDPQQCACLIERAAIVHFIFLLTCR